MSIATNVFLYLPAGFLVWKQMHDLRRKLFLLAAVPMWEAYAKEFFFSLEHCLWKELNHNFFYYVLDIWMDLISDLVTNGLPRLNLPLELNFLCIGLCQIILVLWFFMHYVHENVVVGIDLWWFPHIIQKNLFFLDFIRHCFQFSKTYQGSAYQAVACNCSRPSIVSCSSVRFRSRNSSCMLQRTGWSLDNMLPNGNRETPRNVEIPPG